LESFGNKSLCNICQNLKIKLNKNAENVKALQFSALLKFRDCFIFKWNKAMGSLIIANTI